MSDVRIPSRNNFDLLRLVFAATVMLTHFYELSGSQELKMIPLALKNVFLTSGRAWQGFFIISGFLIFMSYERSKTVFQYLGKRVRRLYPGYAANIILTALLLSLLSTLPLWAYVTNPEFWKFLLGNLAFYHGWQWSLPGVFTDHRFTAVNGALWTLQIEVLFYLSVPFIFWFARKLRMVPVLVFLYTLSYLYMTYWTESGNDAIARLFPGQLMYFVSGAFLYMFFDGVVRFRHPLLLLALVVHIFDSFVMPVPFLLPLALAMIVLYVACFIPFLGNASRFGDFSYAIYIAHFPIAQTFLEFLPPGRPWLFEIAAISLTFLAGFSSWHLIEKRFLLKSSHYVRHKAVITPA